jgi:hypothetical protein
MITAMHRQMTLAVLGVLLLSGCSVPPPPMGRGLSHTVAQMTPDFDRRMNQRFPVGSDEGELLAELRVERFTIKQANEPSARYRLTALYEGHGLVCRTWWTVEWSAEQGKITAIGGEYSQSCL